MMAINVPYTCSKNTEICVFFRVFIESKRNKQIIGYFFSQAYSFLEIILFSLRTYIDSDGYYVEVNPIYLKRGKMKKVFTGLFVIVFVLGMVMLNVPQTAKAATNSALAPGEWEVPLPVIGTAVSVTSVGAPSYLQLITEGIKTTAPALICHQFRGAGFDWIGEVRQLVDGTWVKVKTTTALAPAPAEGIWKACAQTYNAGTYALFAYYHVPTEDDVLEDVVVVEKPGLWNRGNVVSLDFVTYPRPSWLDSYSNGIEVTSYGEICHPFPAGNAKMVAEIRQLKAGLWVRLATTFRVIPEVDGVYSACAMAPEAGIYTLFGYVEK
jgi:hypothetical protein